MHNLSLELSSQFQYSQAKQDSEWQVCVLTEYLHCQTLTSILGSTDLYASAMYTSWKIQVKIFNIIYIYIHIYDKEVNF